MKEIGVDAPAAEEAEKKNKKAKKAKKPVEATEAPAVVDEKPAAVEAASNAEEQPIDA